MKERETFPGKTYAVTSPNGCTVTTDDGLTLAEIEAGKQGYFVAVSGNVTLSDADAKLTELFNLAPYQKLRLLGVVGGDSSGLPAGYKRVEYLESTGTQWMYIPVNDKKEDTLEVETYGAFTSLQNGVEGKNGGNDSSFFWGISGTLYAGVGGYNVSGTKPDTGWHSFVLCKTKENGGFFVDDKKLLSMPFPSVSLLGGWGYGLWKIVNENRFPNQVSKKASVKFIQNGKLIYDFVPALDPTGAPCMFDLVSRKSFYNQGTGDFLYPTETVTYALRRVLPDWGKLTAHGLRRLYHAPAGYAGELYDYALEHGFKPIVETEQPAEGYWAPRWRETEDEIVLEWVETEPPMPEETT